MHGTGARSVKFIMPRPSACLSHAAREHPKRGIMIGCFTVKRRVKVSPEVVLWRWMVLVLGQVLA
jgi:hypothetical protein